MNQTPDLTSFKLETTDELKKATSRAGRKQKQPADKRDKKVSTNLTGAEKKAFSKALDGRSEAKILRELIIEYIGKNRMS